MVNKVTSDTIRCSKLRIATIKETGEKRRLAWLGFSEKKAVLYGPVTEVKYDSKGIPCLFHDEEGRKTVPLESITWEEVDFNEELAKTL